MSRISVLIVADSEEARATLREALGNEKFEFLTARSLEETRVAVASRTVDAIVVDDEGGTIDAMYLGTQLKRAQWRGAWVLVTPSCDPLRYQDFKDHTDIARVFLHPLVPEEFAAQIERTVNQRKVAAELAEGKARFARSGQAPAPESAAQRRWKGELARLRQDYRSRLSSQVQDLATRVHAWRGSGLDHDREEARRLAHTIKGTAATYRFAGVSHAASLIEKHLVNAHKPTDVDARAMDDLFALATASIPPSEAITADAEGTIVLVVDTDPATLLVATRVGVASHIDVVGVQGFEAALLAAQKTPFDAAFIDTGLPEDKAFELVRELRKIPGLEHLPVAMMHKAWVRSAPETGPAETGAIFLEKPLTQRRMSEALHALTTTPRSSWPTVLVADDDPAMASFIEAVLTPHRFDVVSVRQGDLVLRTMEEYNPDLVILDVFMPLVSGFDVCRLIRGSRFANIPVLFTTAHTSKNVRLACFRAGGDDFIQKPLIEEELVARVSSRLQRLRHAHQVDPASGALTRSAFLSEATHAWSDTTAAAVIALNHFKSINATYGFEAGDAVLRGVADILRRALPMGTPIGRWSGDEFAIVLKGESRTTITALMQRTIRQIEVATFHGATGQSFGVTCRMGAAATPRDGGSLSTILAAADLRTAVNEATAPATVTPPPAPTRPPMLRR